MALAELIPTVLALSRLDKLRLIQTLAEDLAISEDSGLGSNKEEALGTTGTTGVEPKPGPASPTSLAQFEQLWTHLIETGQSLPVRFPDESHEAAAIMMRMLEAEKPAS